MATAQAKIFKVLALPPTYQPNAIYHVKQGDGLVIYQANREGTAVFRTPTTQDIESSQSIAIMVAQQITDQATRRLNTLGRSPSIEPFLLQ